MSYYGGGHYDSIVDAKHSDQLLLSVPGVAESLALSRVAERVALASSTSSIVNIARVNGSQASEEAALDLAMQMSRNDENRFSWQDDIETCLSMSLEESYLKNNKMSQSSDEYVTKKIPGDDNCAKKSVAFAEHSLENNDLNGVKMEISSSSSSFSSVLSPIGIDMNIKNDNDNDNDNNAVSIAIQSDTLRIAVEESERDYIDSAMLSSLQDETQNMEEEMLRQVRLESLLESQAADARMMADTYGFDNESKMSSILNFSAYEYENSNRDRNGAIDEAQGEGDGKGKEFDYNIETPSEVDLILKLSELSEEEALQLALKESASTSSLYSTAVRPNMYEYGSYGLRSPRSPYFELGGRGAHTGLAPVVLGLEQCVGGDGQSQSQANIDGQGHMKTESETLQDAMRLYMKSVTSSTYPLANPQNANNNSTTTTSSSSSSSSSSTIGNSRETVADSDVLSSSGNRISTSYGNEIRRTPAEEAEDEDEERELQRAIAESLK